MSRSDRSPAARALHAPRVRAIQPATLLRLMRRLCGASALPSHTQRSLPSGRLSLPPGGEFRFLPDLGTAGWQHLVFDLTLTGGGRRRVDLRVGVQAADDLLTGDALVVMDTAAGAASPRPWLRVGQSLAGGLRLFGAGGFAYAPCARFVGSETFAYPATDASGEVVVVHVAVHLRATRH